MNNRYDNDTANKPHNPTARIEDIASALEEILAGNQENYLIQSAIPRLIRNIKDYNLNYHSEAIDGHALYFEIRRLALKIASKGNRSYESALKSLIEGVFSKENPELENVHKVFSKYDLSNIIESAVSDYASKNS